MIEKIEVDKKIYAIIIRNNYNKDGIEFFTPNNYSQQLGYMKRPSGYEIKPHTHKKISKKVEFTQEVLFIKSGKLRVDFYNNEKKYLQSKILTKGDVILLSEGGHGFKVIDECEIYEVKQGPYDESNDKERFDGVLDKETEIK
tara:strand:+ start:5429 stop:5857 length:429 start_codon:yes stop_codon:yes gene_type:complete